MPMSRSRLLLYFLAIVGYAVCSLAYDSERARCRAGERITKDQQFLKLVDLLVSQRPFRLDAVSQATGMQFEKSPASNDYFSMYDSKTGSTAILKNVEVRLPAKASVGKDGMVILRPGDGVTLTSRDIRGHFGQRPKVNLEIPDGPPHMPFYYTYRIRGGEARFGFGPGADERLVEVVLDAIEPSTSGR
jgi:hypothetical protein